MASHHSTLSDEHRRFIEAQHLFFVATAPLSERGHVNLSPKGLDSFRVIDERSVAYLDFVGSGAETIAHLRENGRITIMFCAFDGPPKILRIHGRGRVIEPADAEFAEALRPFSTDRPARAIIAIAVERVSVSCGYGVPLFRFESERSDLDAWCDRKGSEGIRQYQIAKNAQSLDGLPALRWVASEGRA
jgi:predicted pyridoxine 5'-phosphate oxidase superfamily flavin-nucleotide-binding protein